MKKIIACTLAMLAVVFAFGQERCDSVKVYFHIRQWQFDPAYADNGASMDKFVESVRRAVDAHNLDRIVIRSYCSPDGPDRLNERLTKERCATVVGLLVDRAGISRDLIEGRPQGVAWDELRSLVASNPRVPQQKKVLRILDHTPVYKFDAAGRIVDGRKKQLMELRGGRTYNWLAKNIFPELRNAVAVSLYYRQPGDAESAAKQATEVETGDSFNADVAETDSILTSTVELDSINGIIPPHTDTETDSTPQREVSWDSPVAMPYYRMAVKTNMLYYAALLPNLELEYLINDHWSVAAEGNLAWWGSYNRNKSYRLVLMDGEVRRWIKPRAPWHGMYAGLVAGGGYFDILKDNPGRYGWGVMAGLTFGYSWPVGRRLSLEAEAGLGYAFIRYKEYEPKEGHHVYLRTKEVNYFGPIKLKFSIAWHFLDYNKPKPANPAL